MRVLLLALLAGIAAQAQEFEDPSLARGAALERLTEPAEGELVARISASGPLFLGTLVDLTIELENHGTRTLWLPDPAAAMQPSIPTSSRIDEASRNLIWILVPVAGEQRMAAAETLRAAQHPIQLRAGGRVEVSFAVLVGGGAECSDGCDGFLFFRGAPPYLPQLRTKVALERVRVSNPRVVAMAGGRAAAAWITASSDGTPHLFAKVLSGREAKLAKSGRFEVLEQQRCGASGDDYCLSTLVAFGTGLSDWDLALHRQELVVTWHAGGAAHERRLPAAPSAPPKSGAAVR